jgi:hypothetical protein
VRGMGFGYQATRPKGVFVEPFLATFEVKTVSPILSLKCRENLANGQFQNPDPVPRRELQASTARFPKLVYTSFSEIVFIRLRGKCRFTLV